ncbi:hypothetical protein ACRALDRAFT_1050340 [Sodiomyces alcalophilus JCM 7366]|uniref:uncharacterized protein n=1 Tax=Sodiomyces alcalophilus JCM 7366 TaxID=591952 RepID=UPI0039B64FEC
MEASRLSSSGRLLYRRLPGCRPIQLTWSAYRLFLRRNSLAISGAGHRTGHVSATRALSTTAAHHSPLRLKDFLKISDEVADAVATNKPVVALESTIYTHGALGNDLGLEDIVRQGGAVPAVCGIFGGRPTVGLTPDEIARMVDSGTAKKASRRDIAYLAGLGFLNRKLHGGTTISGTMLLARLAGIRVFGTGGLGGVHRGGEDSMDVSADLTELGRTRVAVISSGCKGFLDIPRTLEYLETQGALVATFADRNKTHSGPVEFPAFWARSSGVKSPAVVDSERDAAAMILAQETLGIESGMLFANPIPEEYAIPRAEMDAIIETAVRGATEKGFTGSDNTPYVLRAIRDMMGDRSTLANKALVRSNVERATQVAVELCRLLAGEPVSPASAQQQQQQQQRPSGNHFFVSEREMPATEPSTPPSSSKVDILVAGSVAVDLSCDYHPLNNATTEGKAPQLETSNPAAISQTVGGVGHNVALAAHRVSQENRVRLCSLVGNDTAGTTVMNSLQASGLDTTYVKTLGHDSSHASARTAQYVAVNDTDKNLVLAMADMGIFTNHSVPDYWNSAVARTKPEWLVVDGNWNPRDIRAWVQAGRANGAKVAFEPVSTAKSVGLFARDHLDDVGVFPASPAVDLASPNHHELAAMWTAAKENGFLDAPRWWEVIDAFGLLGARDRFVRLTSAEIADAGIPVQSVQLLPYIPTIVAKLGSRGCLLTTILGRDDPRLRDAREEEWILTRSLNDHPHVGGVYMRMFPPAEKVEDVVSVNGVGDTFLGVLVAGLAKGGKVEKLMDVAQRAAVLTLKGHESVSPDLGRLESQKKKKKKTDWEIGNLSTDCITQHSHLNTMADHQDFEGFSDESSLEEEVDSSEDESEPEIFTNHQPNKNVTAKDAEETELERLVLGDSATFRDQLFSHDPLSDLELLEKQRQLQLSQPQDPGLEDVADADLFFLDTAPPTAPGEQAGQAKAQDEADGTDADAPAWVDSDDERLTVSLAGVSQLRKLRITADEDVISGAEYARRLRRQYLTLNPLPAWAKQGEGRPTKRRRRSSAAGSDSSASSSEGEGDDGDDLDMSAAPLDRFMRDVAKMAGQGPAQKRKLRPEMIDIQRTRPIPDTHKAAVNNLSFHPEYPVLLSSSVSSVLFLHHINPTAHPTPNPMLTSVQAKLIDVRRAEFLYPSGEQIFFAGRRRYFHSWHLESGVVEKTARIQGGHKAEHKSMEHFRLSPCGRYMGIVASTRKGGGLVNIISVASRQWIAAARLDSRHGIADFTWWSTGDGLSILGRDGSVGEYSMVERRFLGVWRDEGCVGGIVVALGGHQGPGVLGDDRWVAVGSSSGVTNIYDRNELLVGGGVGGDGEEVTITSNPEPTRRFEQLVTPITVIAFSPDGQLMAFGSREKKDALRLVHLPSCTVYRNWPTEKTPLGRITSVAFGRGSDLLAVGNDAGKVRLWDIRS